VTNIQQKKERVAMLSVASNSFLVLFKVIVGFLIGSVSIMSEAIHSGVDLLAAIIAMFSVKTSSVPADSDHPFGHGKIENISGFVEALLIFYSGLFWIYLGSTEEINLIFRHRTCRMGRRGNVIFCCYEFYCFAETFSGGQRS